MKKTSDFLDTIGNTQLDLVTFFFSCLHQKTFKKASTRSNKGTEKEFREVYAEYNLHTTDAYAIIKRNEFISKPKLIRNLAGFIPV